jgi:hypothetical protein
MVAKKKADKSKTPEVIKKVIPCSQCGQHQAMYGYLGQNLCLDCYERADYLHQVQLTRLINMANQAQHEMDQAIGFLPYGPSPQIPNFVPRPPRQTVTLTNFNFDRTNIGSLNTGNIKNLDVALTIMQGADQSELANDIKGLTEAIVASATISEQEKNEVLEYLSFLAQQATVPDDQRSKGIGKGLLERIPTILSAGTALLTLWEKIAPRILELFN